MELETRIKIALDSESLSPKRISIVKKYNKFESGDIVIPKGCIDIVDKEVLSRVRKKLFEELNEADFPVTEITEDAHNCIVIYLDRKKLFQKVIKTAINDLNNYGKRKCELDKTVLFCNDNLMKSGHGEHVSLECLRSAVLQEHSAYLLQSQSYCVISPIQNDVRHRLKDFLPPGPVSHSYVDINQSDIDSRLISGPFLACPFISSSNTVLQSEDLSRKNEDSSTMKIYEFDMKKYLLDKHMPVGKNNFDKNLAVCSVCESDNPTEILQTACTICQCCKDNNATVCIHITGPNQAFNKQKVHLTLQVLTETDNRNITQKHLVYGSVTQRKKSKDSDISCAEDLFRLRYDQMRQAAILKYSEAVHGEGWASTLESLTSACIKFEMLSCVHRNTLKLDLMEGDEDGNPSTADGSFVMYNYARLSTLFKHFEEAVVLNTYPPLPPIEEIDFKTLREEAEWCLLYNYVYTFPSLVEQTIEYLEDTSTILANIHTHKISQMLCSLSRSVSSYYSRFHVLGEPRPHLLPTMYARIYLLKAVHQVMANGLALMGIQPLSQL